MTARAETIAKAIRDNGPVDWMGPRFDQYARIWATAADQALPRDAEAALEPAESMALSVAWAQVQRGEHPSPNVAVVCVATLARLTGREGAK